MSARHPVRAPLQGLRSTSGQVLLHLAFTCLALGISTHPVKAQTVATRQAPVVTVITHGAGWQPSQVIDDKPWLAAMADAIRLRQEQSGAGAVPVYEVFVAPTFAGSLNLQTIAPPAMQVFRNGAIITVNWTAVAGMFPYYWTSDQVADEVAKLLLANPQLLSLPIHLIGHSRGGSVMAALATRLGRRGAWIDQLTTLDPHPVSFDESVDRTGQNVLFADNYRQTIEFPSGEFVAGAHETNLDGVFVGTPSKHGAVHSYYHGTVDTATSSVAGEPILQNWYPADSQGRPTRGTTGYVYAKGGGGDGGRQGHVDGLHLHLGGSGQRWQVALDNGRPSLPNIALRPLKDGYAYEIGSTVPLEFYYQDRQYEFDVVFRFDDDTNPLTDDLSKSCAQFNQDNTPQISSHPNGLRPDTLFIRSTQLSLATTGAVAGACYLRAEIRNNYYRRFDYLPTKVTLSSGPPQPTLNPPEVLGLGDQVGPGVIVSSLMPQLSWAPVPAASGGYGLAISQFPYGPSHIVLLRDNASPLTGTSFTVPAGVLVPGARYRWNMVSFAGSSESANSTTLYFQTPPAPGASYIIQTSAYPLAGGTTAGAGNKPAGSSVTVSATPTRGFTFTVWTEGGVQVSTSAGYTFTANGNRDLVAHFAATGTPPVIAGQPQSLVVDAGATAVFRVYATGGGPLSYQWRRYGVALPGQTSDTLTLPNVSPSDSASYTVLVSNATGTQLSDVATLTVNAGAALRVVNGMRVTEAPPYLVNGASTVNVILRNVSASNLSIDRIQVDGDFQDYFGDPPYVRNWPAANFVPPLQLAPGATYTYVANNASNVFPGVPATATARAYVKFAGVPGLQVVTDADPDSTAVLAFQTVDPNQVFPINVQVEPSGAGTVSGAGNYISGTMATLTATANSCFAFSAWTRNGVPVANWPVYSFYVNGAPNIVAEFVPAPCDGAPRNLTSIVQGNTVTLSWLPPPAGALPVLGYVVEAGFSPGATALSLPLPNQLSYSTGAPEGFYYVRVRAQTAAGISAASNEVQIGTGQAAAPLAPLGLLATVQDSTIMLEWKANPQGPVATSYVVQAGTANGLSNFAVVSLPATQTTLATPAPPGNYFVRVLAANAAGQSPPTPEVFLVIGGGVCSVPAVPTGVSASASSGVLTLRWKSPTAGAIPTSYRIDVGTASRGTQLGSFTVPGSQTIVEGPVPPGQYFLRVTAVNACGASAPSTEVVAAVTNPAALTMDDDYDDNSLNPSLWNAVSAPSVGTIAEVRQRLEMARLTPGSAYQGIQSRCAVAGDFDVQVDFSLLNWPPQNYNTLRLVAMDLPEGPLGKVGIYRNSYANENYQFRALSGMVAEVARADGAGRLRLKRTGSTIQAYYWDGGSAVLLGSWTTALTATTFLLDFASTSDGVPVVAPAGVTIAFDDFRVVQGTVICPSGTAAPPSAPRSVSGTVSGNVATVSWQPPATGAPIASYIVRAGTSPGVYNLFNGSVGLQTSVSAPLASGIYYVSVAAQNASGVGPSSPEIALSVSQPTSMDDDFNANLIDSSRWFVLSPPVGGAAVNVSAVNQRLEIAMGAGFGGGGLYSRCFISGDFDIQIDYGLLAWPPANLHNLRLGVSNLGVGSAGAFGLSRSNSGSGAGSERYNLSTASGGVGVTTSAQSGAMRLVRTGATLSGLVLESGSWVSVGTGSIPTGPAHANLDLGVAGPAPGGTIGAFDNFRVNAGQVTCQ